MSDAIRPGKIWTDTDGQTIQAHGGGMLKFNGTYYWYGENKSTNRPFNETGVSCYSSKDCIHWKHEGVVLPAVKEDPSHDLHMSKIVERPKVIYNAATRKFVMFMHVDDPSYDYAKVGIAVCDTPNGVFTYVGSQHPNRRLSRDMTVFQDEDGSAYLFTSSDMNSSLRVVKLTDDYLGFGRYHIVCPEIENECTREAPAVFKRNGKYYMITSGCTGWAPNAADCMVAEDIMGEWTSVGNPCQGPDAELTFYAQSAFVFEKSGTYVLMADRWNPENLGDSRYVWLPIRFERDQVLIEWLDEWNFDD